jgi:hypothetical protein
MFIFTDTRAFDLRSFFNAHLLYVLVLYSRDDAFIPVSNVDDHGVDKV